MKSTGRRLGVVAALALALAAAGPLASAAGAAVPTAAKPKAVATLKIQKPVVSVKKKGASNLKPAKDGQKLHEGDTVQTDATGLAEVDYSDNSYTRLDVNTTLKIVKLSDNQGNRQVETSVDAGRTWNRTAALTESQSFVQSGAGATAAVVGTAFAVQCDAPVAPATVSGHCTTIAIEHVTKWTGADGVSINLNPLDSCDATNGVLCQNIAHLTPDQLDSWIQSNLYLDLVLRGLGPGPITGTVVVQNGQATFTPSTPGTPATTTTTGGTTPTNGGTTPVAPPTIDQTNPVQVGPAGGPYAGASNITAEDERIAYFKVNQTGSSTVGISTLPSSSIGVICAPLGSNPSTNPCNSGNPFLTPPAGYETVTTNPSDTFNKTTQFDPNTQFAFVPSDHETPVSGPMTETATNSGGTTSQDVQVQVTENDAP